MAGDAERGLDNEQIAVVQSDLQRRDPGVAAQHEQYVAAGLGLGLFLPITKQSSLRSRGGEVEHCW